MCDSLRSGSATEKHYALYHRAPNKGRWRRLNIRKVMENISHPRTHHQMCQDLWEQSQVAKALLWALLSQAAIQHLQLIKLSRVPMIKTKERSVSVLQHCATLIFAFRLPDLMKMQLGLNEIGILRWAFFPLLFFNTGRALVKFSNTFYFHLSLQILFSPFLLLCSSFSSSQNSQKCISSEEE